MGSTCPNRHMKRPSASFNLRRNQLWCKCFDGPQHRSLLQLLRHPLRFAFFMCLNKQLQISYMVMCETIVILSFLNGETNSYIFQLLELRRSEILKLLRIVRLLLLPESGKIDKFFSAKVQVQSWFEKKM